MSILQEMSRALEKLEGRKMNALEDPSNEGHETQYWAAYLDGARAQLRECEREKGQRGTNES